MEIGTFRGILTAVLMLLFVGVVIWAFSRNRRAEFDAAAKLPLGDDRKPPRSQPRAGAGTETD